METRQSLRAARSTELARRFGSYQRLTVRQRKRWVEILLSFELKNSYDVYDETQTPVLRVRELGTGIGLLLKRIFLGPFRSFRAAVQDLSNEEPVLHLHRPFRFIFHRLEVTTPDGERLGAIQRRWSWLRRIYVIEDAQGQEVANLFGPILRPWTFEVRVGEQVRGTISKRWSGLLKETFTDADNFGVDLGTLGNPPLKALTFAATVLLDVVHFERSKG